MEIKELLLREIGKFKNNKIIFSNYHVSTDNMNKHNQPIFYSKKGNLYEKTNILMSNIRPYFNKVWYSDRTGSKSSNVLCFVVTNNNVLSKYAYYLICSDKFNNFWSKTSKGTTMPVGDKEAILNFKFKICDKANQQAIINIIEPFEKLQNSLKKKINTLEIMMLKIANQSYVLGKMKNFDIDFEKGINIKSIYLTNQKTDKTFINVSAINNKPNKYVLNCEVIENINYGDVVLSLDGTIGLVNNFLKGVNGYGYKVTSNNIHNSIIYCSLIDERNKKIIQENSNGSVIKHSSNSKKELLLLDIQNKNVISFFNLQVIYKKTLNIIDYIIDKLINLCL